MNSKNKIIAFVVLSVVVAVVPATKVDANARSLDIVTDDDVVPLDVRIACDVWGQSYGISPELLEAIAYHESRFVKDAKNGTCVGLMQINTAAHEQRLKRLGVTDLEDINCNVMVAADILAELFADNEDVCAVLGMYHGEHDAAGKAERGILSPYVRKILEKSEEFERAHGK